MKIKLICVLMEGLVRNESDSSQSYFIINGADRVGSPNGKLNVAEDWKHS